MLGFDYFLHRKSIKKGSEAAPDFCDLGVEGLRLRRFAGTFLLLLIPFMWKYLAGQRKVFVIPVDGYVYVNGRFALGVFLLLLQIHLKTKAHRSALFVNVMVQSSNQILADLGQITHYSDTV